MQASRLNREDYKGFAIRDLDGSLKSLGKWVFIEIYDVEETKGGLIVIESKRTHIRKAKVISCGPDGVAAGIQDGDDVILADFRMEVLDGNYGFVETEHICGIVE